MYDDEYMDVVNEDDIVIGKASQEEVYTNYPLHRTVHVMAFDSSGRIGLQKRSAKKSYKPLHWVTATSGHPRFGETYEQAAIRETVEELGFVPQLNNFQKLFYTDPDRPGLRRFLGVFDMEIKGLPRYSKDEVAEFRFFDRTDIKKLIKRDELFHPELLFVLNEVYGF